MISSRVRHNKTHPNGHHDVHARQTRDRRGKNRQNLYLQPDWRSSAVPVQPVMSRVGWVSDGTCTKRKMFDLPRTPNGGCVRCDRGRKVWVAARTSGARRYDSLRVSDARTCPEGLSHDSRFLSHEADVPPFACRTERNYRDLVFCDKWAGQTVTGGSRRAS